MEFFTEFTLDIYDGPWGQRESAHLLRRTTYGPRQGEIKLVEELGLEKSVELLLVEHPLPSPPINFSFEDDPLVPIGRSWVGIPLSRIENANQLINSRLASLYAWQIGLILEGSLSIREKMTLFWHNHFVTSEIREPEFQYINISLYRNNFDGNFRDLTKMTTIDPAMLRYLNGNQNTKTNPNENYSRELLELFTIGKGPQVGEGDYTNYTEADILAISKILTGWTDKGYLNRGGESAGAIFHENRHDTSSKTLSHRFGNRQIPNLGSDEYAHLIDIIFEQDEVSRFIVRKIYRWFIYHEIDETIEKNIIDPLAALLRENNYEIKPVLETLLKSRHFYDNYAIGSIIKNPLDFMADAFKQLEVQHSDDILIKYALWARLAAFADTLQLNYFEAPSVAGWKAYYQAPLYYRSWINSTTLTNRILLSKIFIQGIETGRIRFRADLLKAIESVENASDPNELIKNLGSFLTPNGISESQLNYLKSVLLPGLPDYEWTIEYDQYRSNTSDMQLKNAVENRLKALFIAFMNLSEYQLS